jgi:TolA-binding protein
MFPFNSNFLLILFVCTSCQSSFFPPNAQQSQKNQRQQAQFKHQVVEKLNSLETQVKLLQSRYEDLQTPETTTPSSNQDEKITNGDLFSLQETFFQQRYFPLLPENQTKTSQLKKEIKTAFGKKDYNKVIALAKQIYSLTHDETTRAWAHRYRAESFFHLEKYRLAAVDFLEFIEAWPNNQYTSRAYFLAGQSFEAFDKTAAQKTYHTLMRTTNSKEFSQAAERRLKALIYNGNQETKKTQEKSLDDFIDTLETASD